MALEVSTSGGMVHLLADPALYIPQSSTLVVSDLHIGKAGHFRKNGIAVPASTTMQDMRRLSELFKRIPAKEVVFLGDMGHSDVNNEWRAFADVIRDFPDRTFILTRGNHDREVSGLYRQMGIDEVVSSIQRGGFCLSHEPIESKLFNITGHEHPAVLIKGKARQSLRMPCFYFLEHRAVMPAFLRFSGHYVISPSKDMRVFPVVEQTVMALSSS